MSTYTDIELPVEHLTWHWEMSRARLGNRHRIEGDIAVRFLRRFVERKAATLAADPVVSLLADCYVSDHWMRSGRCLTLSGRFILGGRRFGLPERLHTEANVVALAVPDRPIEVGR